MRRARLLSLVLIVVALGINGLYAQDRALKGALNQMEILDYSGAIESLNKILDKYDSAEAKIALAECYRKVSDVDNAEYWYGQVVNLPEAETEHYLFYGYMLQRNGKCDMAREWFTKFVEAKPEDNRGQHLLRACDYEDELMVKNAGIYEIEHMDFNTGLDDFGTAYFGDGIVFASESAGSSFERRLHCWTGNPFLDLMYVEREAVDSSMCDYTYGEPEKFSNKLNSKYHDAIVSFAEDNTIFFTRNNLVGGKARKDDEGIVRLKIFSAENANESGNTFSDLTSLPFNSDEYSVAHPALSTDGNTLYFASDMPGGFGGMDLYSSNQEDGRWGPPVNLGPKVNTEGHEVFPFYAQDNKLYFSSDGHVGLGGLDVYTMEKKKEFNEWGEIINIGYPINTRDDDFAFVINEERTCGYVSSDREGGFGDDDIYSFRRNAATVKIYVYDEQTNEPIEGATVISDCTGATAYTDSEGFALVEQKLNQCCQFSASKETYTDNDKQGCTTGLQPGEEVFVEIPLNRPVDYVIRGKITNKVTGAPLPGAKVILTNSCGDMQQEMIADDNGDYIFELKEDCCYTVSASNDGFFGASTANNSAINPEDMCTKPENRELIANLPLTPFTDEGYTGTDPTNPINPNRNPSTDPREPGVNPYNPPGTNPGTYPPGTNPGPTYTTPSNPGSYSPTPFFGTGDDIIREASRNEPIECCAVFEGLSAFGNDFEVSPSVTYNSGGGSYSSGGGSYSSGGGSASSGGSIPFLLHIYYDFDQSYIRNDADGELTKLYNLLQENPTIVVEIGSHTDSRGSGKYNDRLSQRRAESVVRWLRDKGIDKSRLVATGYGETQNVNQCANNVPCSEEEHQLNRRTEFRVIGLTDGTQFSQPRSGVNGRGCDGCPF